METRTLLILCCLLTAGLVAVALIAPSAIPAMFRTGTTTTPVVPAVATVPPSTVLPTTPTAPVTPVPPDTPGTLTITSTPPGAEVWIDTDPAPSGTTPATLSLSPIGHPLMLKYPGYREYVTSVDIPPGSNVSLSVQMEPAR